MTTTSEDLIASDSVEGVETNVSDELNCTLCLKIFRSPRSLPCSHSFCHDCLQSHISHSASVKDTLKEFSCPICETGVCLEEDIALDKWVYSFPLNTLLLSVLIKLKVKVDIVCDVYQAHDTTCPAENICIVCEQALCENCSKVHKSVRYLKTHAILKVNELASRQYIVLKHNSMFRCVDHAYTPLDLYCKTHEVHLCSKCFTSKHKGCFQVFDVNNESPNISDILNDVKVQIKELEDQYKRFTDVTVSNLKQLDSQVHTLLEEISALKKRIHAALDDMETRVKTECQKIYCDEKNKLEKYNLRMKSQIMSIKNSNFIVNSVCELGTESQTFLLANRILSQLSLSLSQADKMYNDNAILKLELEIKPQLKSIVLVPKGELVKIKVTRNRFFVPTMPQAVQRGFFTPHTMPQMRAGPRWPTVIPSQPAAQTGGFQSLPSGPQVRPARPSGAAQYNMRPNVNVRAIAGPNTTTQPRATMPVTHSNVRVRSAPANMYPQQRQRPFKLPEQPMRNVPQTQNQRNPPLYVVVQGQEPLTSHMLDSAPPQEQKQMLGERLFPLIQRMYYPDLAGKITGMLLELDNYELLHMLDSSESLKAKVDEALALLIKSRKET
ncbi:hypothetical protein ACJMK2_000734 [Sinanodonta woodiana]|uniref:Uncharacterized protein n=1 Tax=Sinanodonta woodiana TaxID=1069815 RepID=A0ABD3XQA1_SINWO